MCSTVKLTSMNLSTVITIKDVFYSILDVLYVYIHYKKR